MPIPADVVLGVDAGGTKVALGLVDRDGRVLAHRRLVNAEAADQDELLQRVAAAGRELAAEAGGVTAVGFSTCELVDRHGAIRSAEALSWTTAQVHAALGAIAPLVIESDARALARAEARLGAGRGIERFLSLTVGTGISCCLVAGGEPDPGARGFAQCAGSTRLWDGASLEELAAGPAVARHAGTATAEEAVARAAAGDEHATRAVREAAALAGGVVALLVDTLDPQAVVVGGGLGAAPGPYREALVAAARERVWTPGADVIPIVPARLGADAALVGAALAAAGRGAAA